MSAPVCDQEFCLKWNNHRSTILTVMDNLLEEESLVDVTLSADGQFIRAHRIILSACSPYFRQLFKSTFLTDKHPVVIMKDVDFDNLKSLVEYMYKGEANVPQQMLPSFIQTAESLQIRGLTEGSQKQRLDQVSQLNMYQTKPNISVPVPVKQEKLNKSPSQTLEPGSILAARLAKMVENPPIHMLDFHQQLASLAAKTGQTIPPPAKKPRKTPVLTSLSPTRTNMKQVISVKKDIGDNEAQLSPNTTNIMTPVSQMVHSLTLTNNNDESDSDVLKIDEDRDYPQDITDNINDKDEGIAEEEENGMNDSEEEILGKDLNERTGTQIGGFINPWTGEPIPSIPGSDKDEDSLHEGSHLDWARVGIKIPEFDLHNFGDEEVKESSDKTSNKVQRLTNTDSVFTMCQTPDGPKFQCVMCARIFNLKCTLLRHVRHQHQGRFVPHPCKACGQVFKRTDHLKVHMKKIHNLSDEKKHINSSLLSNPLVN